MPEIHCSANIMASLRVLVISWAYVSMRFSEKALTHKMGR
jgi:hypothetical protein